MKQTKICNKCRQRKPLTDYHKHPKSPDGYTYVCKTCDVLVRQEMRLANDREQRQRREKERIGKLVRGICLKCGKKRLLPVRHHVGDLLVQVGWLCADTEKCGGEFIAAKPVKVMDLNAMGRPA